MEFMTLPSKRKVPAVAFGTYQSAGKECYDSVLTALEVGYTHIDTAAYYQNEDLVGKAIRDSKKNREDLFVTTKIWNSEQGTEKSAKSIENSLRLLDIDYIDLMLIHWPIPVGREHDFETLNAQTLEVMAKYQQRGLIKHVGISNFLGEHIDAIIKNTGITPEVNQIEMHLGLPQNEIRENCKEKGILVEAWRPLMRGTANDKEILVTLADKYGKTPSQIALRYVIQKGAVPIPKSVRPERIKENFGLFDFALSCEDMLALDGVDEIRCGSHPLHLTRA